MARFTLAIMVVATLVLTGYTLRPAPMSVQVPIRISTPSPALSDVDRALYAAIFDAQDRAERDMVDMLIPQLDNQILLGHVLAMRYLSADYDSSAMELSDWLRNYGDLPEAHRIASLARRKGVEREVLAMVSTTKPLKGDGYVFHLGRSTMPDGWYQGLRLWKEGQFASAAKRFAATADHDKMNSWQRAAAHYWSYRSHLRQGDMARAATQLELAAAEPLTFYGQLALARQGKSLPVMAQAPSVPRALRQDPHVLRAAAFSALEMDDAAEMELRALYSKLDPADRPALATLAAEMHLPNLQVRLAKLPELEREQALFASYPLPAPMINATLEIIDPALVLSVARHESAFRDNAASGAGAVGMMQMLPSTARHVLRQAERESLSLVDASDSVLPLAKRLHDARLSATLGATYLRMLTREPAIGSNLMKVLAGYNAGPGAVAGWQRSARQINDPLLYLESIPYPETRNYVMQVMAHYWVYQRMMGVPQQSLAQLARGEWPVLG